MYDKVAVMEQPRPQPPRKLPVTVGMVHERVITHGGGGKRSRFEQNTREYTTTADKRFELPMLEKKQKDPVEKGHESTKPGKRGLFKK